VTTTGTRSSRSAAVERSGRWIHGRVRRLLQPRRAHQGTCRQSGTLSATPASNVEAEPETELDPVHERVDIIVPRSSRAARLHRAHRGEGEHEERATRCPAARWRSRRRSSSARRASRTAKRPRDGARLLRAGRRRPPNRARRPTSCSSMSRWPRSRPGPSRSGRASARSRASSPPRRFNRRTSSQRPVARSASPEGIRAPAAHHAAVFEPYFLDSDWNSSVELYDTLYVFPISSAIGGRLADVRVLAHPAVLRLSVTARTEWTRSTRPSTSALFGTTTPAFQASSSSSRSPICSIRDASSPAAHDHVRHTRQSPLSNVRHLLGRRPRRSLRGLRKRVQLPRHRFTGRFYYPLARHRQPGSGFVLKLTPSSGHHEPRTRRASHLPAVFSSAAPGRARLLLRSIGPRLPLTSTLDPTPAQLPRRGISAAPRGLRDSSSSFRSSDKVGIRGVGLLRFRNAWNTETSSAGRRRPASLTSRAACFSTSPAASATCARRPLRDSLVLASRPAPLRMGLPPGSPAYEKPRIFEFTIGNFF